jgi:hypothetical protein
MASPSRVLGFVVLAIWVLSLLLWLYLIALILIAQPGFSYADFVAPLIDGAPFFTVLSTSIIAFVVGFMSMVLYFTYWFRR